MWQADVRERGRREGRRGMDRSIVPDVGRIMRLQITSRLRASAGKTDQSASHCNPDQFVRATLEWQPVIPAPSAKARPRRQFKIDVCAFFARYFSISRHTGAIRLFAESALFAHFFFREWRPNVFCVYSANRSARRDGPSHNSKRIAIIQPRASRPRDRPAFTLRRSFPSLHPSARFYEKRIHSANRKTYLLLSLYLSFRRYPLNEFCSIHSIILVGTVL